MEVRVSHREVRAACLTSVADDALPGHKRILVDAVGETAQVRREAHVLAIARPDGDHDAVVLVGHVSPREGDAATAEG